MNPKDLAAEKFVRRHYEPIENPKDVDGAQMWNGQWWLPIWGCDTLDHIVDGFLRDRAAQATPATVTKKIIDLAYRVICEHSGECEIENLPNEMQCIADAVTPATAKLFERNKEIGL